MRGTVAKRIRRETVGTRDYYVRDSKTNVITLRVGGWRSEYKKNKREYYERKRKGLLQ